MGSDHLNDLVDALRDELEARGARAVSVSAETMDLFAVGSSEPEQSVGSIDAEYDGDPERVRNAARDVDGVAFDSMSTESYAGGDTHVSATLHVVDGGSRGATPGGSSNVSPSTPPQHPNARTRTPGPPYEDKSESEQDPHVRPGGHWAEEDANGFLTNYPVEVWPVREWEPYEDVPALTALRYVPDERSGRREWWTGYVKLAPGLLSSLDWQQLRNRLDAEFHDHPVLSVEYHDGSGWVGWSEIDSVVNVDHQQAGDLTEEMARAALRAREEVLD